MVDPLQPPNLLGGSQPVHHRQLDVHEHEVEAALPPLLYRLTAVHRRVPAHLEPLHEGLEQSQVDDVVFDDQDADRRDRPVEEA